MKRGKGNSTFSCWKQVGAHNCKLNRFWRIGFRWLMDTQFSKKDPKNLKEADETDLITMKCPLIHNYHFFSLKWANYAFLSLQF